ACVLGERYVATTGGSSAQNEDGAADSRIGDFYDLLSWNSAASSSFPVVAGSLGGRCDGGLGVGYSAAHFVTSAAPPTTGPVASRRRTLPRARGRGIHRALRVAR